MLTLTLAGVLMGGPAASTPAPLQILLPLNRKAYQTNEWIDVSVVRAAPAARADAILKLSLTGPEASKLDFVFLVDVTQQAAQVTDHLHLNGRLLRPGKYSIEAASGGTSAKTEVELYSHLRKSSFRLGDWGSRARGAEQAVLGEDSLGFNLYYPAYGGLSADDTIRAGMDYMWNCTMSGGHQMDLRMECDWSDPYVIRGGTARVVRRAFQDRINPNAIGVHFYDEPGLTWHQHPVTKDFTPHNIPAQNRAFKSSFGRDPLAYYQVNPTNPEHFREWMHWGRWKLSFMDAAWQLAAFGVNTVRSDFLPVTQSVYGWPAYADGYYFNVVRSLPVISGHGGYDDGAAGYFYPSFTFEFGRMRDLQKPNWYLPAWYGGMPSDRFRLEQYLSFMNNLQGMMKPPDMTIHRPSTTEATANGIVESNKLMARLGTIFTTMPVTRPEVAVLYSMSQNLAAQAKDMKDNYLGAGHAREKTLLAYLAAKTIHTPLFPVVEEDIMDGTLATHHKAIVLPGVDYLPHTVIQALEAFVTSGGAVLVSDDSKVQIKGAVKLGSPIDMTLMHQISKLWETQNHAELAKVNTVGNYLKSVAPIARTLKTQFNKLGIKPVMECDNPGIIVARQKLGDVEYLFAANASYDDGVGGMNALKTAAATLGLAKDGRAVYDAVLGGPATAFSAAENTFSGHFRFGPGQMRVFARTARPIGGVQALTPMLFSDYTVEQDPLRVEISAAVTDAKGRILAGAVPLEIQLIDPLGMMRYDLYRATDRGMLKLNLPLAVNDPAGTWKLVVRELLAGTEDTATFSFKPPTQCAAVAGATPRAVYFGQDRKNIYRFFHNHQDFTIVQGKAFHQSAERLAQVLKPWSIRCKIVNAADVNKPREISAEEATTWCGMEPGKVKPGRENNPAQVGFDVRGPVILLGAPEDNPLTAALQKWGFLPYKPDAASFPGPGRGMLAWQRDAVGYEQESVTLIAYDEKGLEEAVGSLYDAVAGLDPLTPWQLPSVATLTPAVKAPATPPQALVEKLHIWPDRSAAIKGSPKGLMVLTQDGTLAAYNSDAKLAWDQTVVGGGESWALDVASGNGDLVVVGASQQLRGYRAETSKATFAVPLTEDKPAPVVTFVAVSPNGDLVAAGASNGKLTVVDKEGKRLWTIGGVDPKDKNARPNPYLSGMYSADGKWLAALTQNEVHVLNTGDGKVKSKTGGVSGRFPPKRVGDNLLLFDGRTASIFSPAEGKVIKTVAVPDAGVVSVALAGEHLLAGGEVDGTVRKLKSMASTPKDQIIWENKAERRIVKKIVPHTKLTAVAYWGGLVRILDEHGAVKAERVFSQDVAALDWVGERLVVGLADGRLLGMAPP